MEKEKLNHNESINLIVDMISRTKHKLCIGDGNLMLLWGYLTVAVTILVWVLLLTFRHPAMNWFWFLIWIIGGTVTPHIVRKNRDKSGVTSYTDNISNNVWSLVGWSSLIATFFCLTFMLFAGKDCWGVMLVFALLIVGMAEAVQGIIVKEKSLKIGGIVGVACGIFTMCCLVSDIVLYVNWYMPLFIIAFTAMMIIPGHILNYKAKRQS